MVLLQNRYQFNENESIGQGSYGKIYKGKDIINNNDIAIKIMNLAKLQGVELDLLYTEISTQQSLQHPNIVKIIDNFKLPPSSMVIILELCDSDLNALLKSYGGRIPEAEAQKILIQLMEGFKYMIGQNYIHRDIKPANALQKGAFFKIADFGFAGKINVQLKEKLELYCGTPIYEAPQILQMVPYTAKCDLFSFGIMCYELVYGHHPWSNRAGDDQLLFNIKNIPLRFPVDVKVSEQYKDFVRRCLEFEEENRIDWQEAFKHPFINISEEERAYDQFEIPEQQKLILAKLQSIIQSRGLNVIKVIRSIDKNLSCTVDKNEFFLFVLQLDPRISRKESSLIFDFLDLNKDGEISVSEFERLFCKYDFRSVTHKGHRIISDMKEVIKARKIDFEWLFKEYDFHCDGQLNQIEFTLLMKKLAPGLTQDDINEAFNVFDVNKDKEISLREFKNQLAEGTDLDSQFSPEAQTAQQLLKELKRIVVQSISDPLKIFNNFDKNRSGSLEFNEFVQICQIVEPNSNLNIQQEMFRQVTNGQAISFSEFQNIFK